MLVRLLAAAWCVSFLCGCQGRGEISGSVTFQQKQVVTGTVMAVGSDGVPRSSLIENASYRIRDLPSGPIRLAVVSPGPTQVKVLMRKGEPPPATEMPGWFAIPDKYADFQKSELSFNLQAGENKFDIQLE